MQHKLIFFKCYLEGVQLHHISDDHWVTSCSLGREVAVYDNRFMDGDLSSSLTHQLASINRPLVIREEDGEVVDPHLVVYVTPVQQQIGKDHLLLGEKLEEV